MFGGRLIHADEVAYIPVMPAHPVFRTLTLFLVSYVIADRTHARTDVMSDTIDVLTRAFSEGRLASVPFESVTIVLKHFDAATTTSQLQLFADALSPPPAGRVLTNTAR